MSENPGLAIIALKIIDHTKTNEDQLNEFYNERMAPYVLEYPSPLTFKSMSESNPWPYWTIWPVKDVRMMHNPVSNALLKPIRNEPSPYFSGASYNEVIGFEERRFRKLASHHCYTDQVIDSGYVRQHRAPESVVLDSLDYAPGCKDPNSPKADFGKVYRPPQNIQDFEAWAVTTVYKRVDGKAPMYLAMHEFACPATLLPEDLVNCNDEGLKRDALQLVAAHGQITDSF